MAEKCKAEYYSDCITINGERATLYDLLWHPKEKLGIEEPTLEYLQGLMSCYKVLLKDKDYYRKFNPSNGWGTYEQLVKRTKEYLTVLQSISDNFENYTIIADT